MLVSNLAELDHGEGKVRRAVLGFKRQSNWDQRSSEKFRRFRKVLTDDTLTRREDVYKKGDTAYAQGATVPAHIAATRRDQSRRNNVLPKLIYLASSR
jgi:hypothetical protein